MTYQLSPRLFVENGPAILAARSHAARLVAQEYALLGKDPHDVPSRQAA